MSDTLQTGETLAASVAIAPRVTLADLEGKIAFTHFFTAGEASRAVAGLSLQEGHPALEILTLCVIVLHNGFTLVGKSAPASPENFDAEAGRKFAREDALRQLWPLEGYRLREDLHRAGGQAA